jgi:hypothetical protein
MLSYICMDQRPTLSQLPRVRTFHLGYLRRPSPWIRNDHTKSYVVQCGKATRHTWGSGNCWLTYNIVGHGWRSFIGWNLDQIRPVGSSILQR